MKDWRKPALAVAAGIGLLLLTSKRETLFRSQAERDLDALTNMLLVETAFALTKEEMAQIVFVAINRAKKYKTTLEAVVTPPGRPLWNGSADFQRKFYEAVDHPRYEAAKAFVADVLAGSYRNAGYTGFVHPARLASPPCSGSRASVATFAGQRCLPEFAVNGRRVGEGLFA